jgi:hypothetical protein
MLQVVHETAAQAHERPTPPANTRREYLGLQPHPVTAPLPDMPGCLSTTICFPVVGRFGRRALRRESQSSMSLLHSPTRRPIEPTTSSKRRHSPIYILNDDALLHIFYIYHLHLQDVYENEDGIIVLAWKRQRWWYKLAQVSRRWRYLILESRSTLDLHLFCTNGVPVADMLAHSPPLPLTIFYPFCFMMTAEDAAGALLALSHRDRVRRISLKITARHLNKFIPAMDGLFPILEQLEISPLTELTLPQTFHAPNLRRLRLWCTALPIRSLLLTSTGGLVELLLGDIPQSAYFPLNYILSCLSLMPLLERLTIIFHAPLPSRDVVTQSFDTQIMTHVTLPNLRVFAFHGASTYVEGLLAQISTPVLSVLDVKFFNQPTFIVPRLLQTMQTSEILRFNAVHLGFRSDFVALVMDPHRPRREHPLTLKIMCRHFDRQVVSAIQILATLSPVLSVVERLKLSYNEVIPSSARHNEVDRTQWRELLRPFASVKVLRLQYELVEGFSRSLCSEDGEMTLEILPNLEELGCSGGDVGGTFFTSFINERRAAGCIVRLESPRLRWTW